jgi:hypothetical protein
MSGTFRVASGRTFFTTMNKDDYKLDKCTNSSCPLKAECKRYLLVGKGGKHIHFQHKVHSNDGVNLVTDCDHYLKP